MSKKQQRKIYLLVNGKVVKSTTWCCTCQQAVKWYRSLLDKFPQEKADLVKRYGKNYKVKARF